MKSDPRPPRPFPSPRFSSASRPGWRALLLASALAGCASAAAAAAPAAAERIDLPPVLVENRGQADPAVRFYAEGSGRAVYFADGGLTFTWFQTPEGPDPNAEPAAPRRWTARMKFVDARAVVPQPVGRPLSRLSFFRGGAGRRPTRAPAYGGIVYRDLWPGIDLAYTATADGLKYAFTVAPGADPDRIRLRFEGARAAATAAGGLRVETPLGGFDDEAPLVYQPADGDGDVRTVDASFAPVDDAGRTEFGFRLGAYDASRPLIIDPAIFLYVGFIGGAAFDAASAVAVDADGAAYVTGTAWSDAASFPVAVGPDRTYNLASDVFVAKVSPDGSRLEWAGYLGGAGDDVGRAVAVDASGAVYVAGDTSSADFPAVVGPGLEPGGGLDAFAAKIAPDGASLVYAGFIGGSAADSAAALALDERGAATLAGSTQSANDFPAQGGPSSVFGGGDWDGFLARVAPDGAGLEYAGFLGGEGDDWARGVAVDAAGAAYVAGGTTSTEAGFPAANAWDVTANGGLDGFAAKVAPDGATVEYAGFLGGDAADEAHAIAVNDAGEAFVVGETASSEASFPVTAGPDLTFNGGGDAFVAGIAADGAELRFAGYIGGAGDDRATAAALDPLGALAVTGATSSPAESFPAFGLPGLELNGESDAFLAALGPGGSSLLAAGYLGGDRADAGSAVAVDAAGDFYVAGRTMSTEASFEPRVGPALAAGGAGDAFVAKLRLATPRFVAEGVVNAASFESGPIAPGEIVSIFGLGLGPAEGVGAALDEDGRVSTERAGVQVLFDGDPGPLFFVRRDQINVQAPYSLDGKSAVSVQVVVEGEASGAVEVPVAPSAPGLFRAEPGRPGVLAVDADGALVTASNPAVAGDVIVLYATGEGQTSPPGVTGRLAEPPLPEPVLPVSLTIGGAEAEIQFAGSAPGFAGLMQINAVTPEPATRAAVGEEDRPEPAGAGPQPIVLTIGERSSSTEAFVPILSDSPPTPHDPEPADDEAVTDEDQPVAIDVLANDSDPDDDPLTVIDVRQPRRGEVEIGPDGVLRFTPLRNFHGVVFFVYTVSDPDGNTGAAQVRVTVRPVNDPPRASVDVATTIEDHPVTIDVLANDSDPEDSALTIAGFTQPDNGAVEPAGAGLRYTPNPGFLGTDRFQYSISDGELADSADVSVTVFEETSLTISKTMTSPTFIAGETVVYEITIQNAGPSDAAGAELTDALPSGATFSASGSSAGCAAAGTVVTCGPPTIPAGGSVATTIAAVLDPGASGSLTNTATVSHPGDPNGPQTASVTNSVALSADLAITKTNDSATSVAGAETTYTIVVANHGPSSVSGATVSDNFPAELGGVSWTCVGSAGGVCTAGPASGPLSELVDIPAGGSVAYTVTGTVAADAAGTLVNTAVVNSPAPDPETGNNSATDSDAIVQEADLVVTKSDGVDPVVAGSQLTYTVTVANNGPSDAADVVAAETLPAEATLASTSGCAEDPAGAPTCTLGLIAAGGSAQYTVTVDVPADAPASLTNTVSVASSATEASPGDETVSETTAVVQEADLAITKTDGLTAIVAGETLEYTIVASNPSGPSDLTGAMISDAIPVEIVELSLTSCTPTGGAACDPGSPLAGAAFEATVDLPVGSSVSYVLAGKVDPDAAAGTLSNTATVSAGAGSDPVAANNATADEDTVVSRAADLALAKSAPASAVAGQMIDVTLTVTNNGASSANDIQVSDVIPAPDGGGTLTFDAAGSSESCSASGGGASGDTVVCTAAGPLAPGADQVFTVRFEVSSDSQGSIENSASVTATENDPNASDNAATSSTAVTQEADLEIAKTSSPATITAGGQIIYTIEVSNSGPSDAVAVAVADSFPSDLLPASSNPCSPSISGASFDWQIGTLAAGDSVSCQFTFNVNGDASGTLENQATVSASSVDPNSANDAASTSDAVTVEADLSLTKTGPSGANPGQPVTYSLVVANDGPSAASDIVVTDAIPSPSGGGTLAFAAGSSSAVCSASGAGTSGDVVTCSVGELSASVGENQRALTLVFDLSIDASGSITNSATVSSSSTDPDSANNTDQASAASIAASGGLAVVKQANVSGPLSIDDVPFGLYTITVVNGAAVPAVGVTVADAFPARFTTHSWTCSANGAGSACDSSSGTGDINESVDIGPGGSVVFNVTTAFGTGADESVTNTVTITPPGGFPDADGAGNNSSSVATQLCEPPAITGLDDIVVSEGAPSAADAFRALDNTTASTSIVFSASSDNPGLVSSSNITVNPTQVFENPPNPPLIFDGSVFINNLDPNASGTASITVTATDAAGCSAQDSFELTVQPVDDPPTVSSVPNQFRTDTSPFSVPIGASDPDTPQANLVVTVSSDNQALIPDSGLTPSVSPTPDSTTSVTGTLGIAPNPGATSGVANITLTFDDGSTAVSTVFSVELNLTNTPPTISQISNQTVEAPPAGKATIGPLAFTVDDAETAPTTLQLSGSSTDPLIASFSFASQSANDRTVTIETIDDLLVESSITVPVTITVSDGFDSTDMAFQITIDPPSDP